MNRAEDVMHSGRKNAVVMENSCFRDVLEEMNKKLLGAVSVVDEQYKLVGLITDGDVRRLLLKTQDPLPELFMKNVKNIMGKNPKTVSLEASLEDCLYILEKYSFWVIPVVDEGGKLQGMVHMHDLLKEMSK